MYDLHQLPRESLSPLRDTLLNVLAAFRAGPKPIRMQLCVCLANLAIQMMEWKDVLDMGLGAVAFAAFLKLVFRDMAEMRERLSRIEENGRRQAYYLSRITNAMEAQAYRQGLRLREVKEDGK